MARGLRPALGAGARGLLFAALLASPLLGPLLLPAGTASRTLAFVWSEGRWLVALGAIAGGMAVALARAGWQPPSPWARLEAVLARVAPGKLTLMVMALAFVVYLGLLPTHRRYGPVSGDEPKYLRMAVSLCRDLDADMATTEEAPPAEECAREFAPGSGCDEFAGGDRIEGTRRLFRATAVAVASLASGESPPPHHRWGAGEFQDWTVRGWRGGLWYMQPLGLPVLLAPGACIDERTGDRFAPGPPLAFATLGLLWAFGLAQTARLGAEVSGSTLAGLAAGVATAASAPVLVGAWHFYPAVGAGAAVPWLLRHVRAEGPRLSGPGVLVLGLTAGVLPWLHVKFLLVALVLIGLLLLRLARRSRCLLLAAFGFALPLAALLLFEFHLTGLFRPEGRYIRHGDDVYHGPAQLLSLNLVTGAVEAAVGARHGMLVMAPVLVGGVLAWPLLWRRARRDALSMLALVLGLLVVAAMYGGQAPGPPSRLMSPVFCVPAAILAVGLAERRHWLPFRWTVAALVLATLAVLVPMSTEWRRIINPWRAVPEAANISLDIPTFREAARSPARWVVPPLLLGAALALGARAVARAPRTSGRAPAAVEREVLKLHLFWWAAILAFAAGLALVRL